MSMSTRIFALAAASAGLLAAMAPASAAPGFHAAPSASVWNGDGEGWNHSRRNHGNYERYGYRDRPYPGDSYYDEPVYRNTQVWRGNDGRMYCRRGNGTTGLIVGGAVGALLGRELDGGYNRATGTILGGAAGALLGREVARGRSRCR